MLDFRSDSAVQQLCSVRTAQPQNGFRSGFRLRLCTTCGTDHAPVDVTIWDGQEHAIGA